MRLTIELAHYLKELLDRRNIQVSSLEGIEAPLREELLSGRRKARLLLRSHLLPVPVQDLGDRRLLVESDTLAASIKPGERVIVVVPADDGRRFVLQTSAEKVFVDRVQLHVEDPRCQRRYRPAGEVAVKAWRLPDVLVAKMEAGELEILRDIRLGEAAPAEADPGEPEGGGAAGDAGPGVVDVLYDPAKRAASPLQDDLAQTTPIPGRLVDVSTGGLCLAAPSAPDMNLFNRLVMVHFHLAPSAGEEGGAPSPPLEFQIFGVVRALRGQEDDARIHVMFLKALPEEAVSWLGGDG
ncbi:hypothetical protein HCU62_02640 [Dissulfurirhabdus thermomarina]|nr:hypothetical protein [Dissulfurirhabdus thermomarina]NMX22841.1 hypothetical protein [Dissulfurirhabdus thermomarina]